MNKNYWPPRRSCKEGTILTKQELVLMQHLRDNYNFVVINKPYGKGWVHGVWVCKKTNKKYEHAEICAKLEKEWAL